MIKWLLILALALPCAAASLAWDANSETNLAGYKIYHGTNSRQYLVSTNTTTNTTFTITNLVNGTNYFAVTAFDTDGLESEFSDEVFYIKPNVSPRPPVNLRIRATNAISQIRLLQNTGLNQNYWRETGVAFVPVTNGMVFYQAAAPASAIPKSFMSARPPKGAAAITTRPKRPVIGPPPMPP